MKLISAISLAGGLALAGMITHAPAAGGNWLEARLAAERLIVDSQRSGVSYIPAAPMVYAGCTLPTVPAHIWYFDPVSGNDSTGDGSNGNPWKTLQRVYYAPQPQTTQSLLSTVPWQHRDINNNWIYDNSSAPIHPGDAIYLKSGNYGDISIGATNQLLANTDWITIQPAPGATPKFNTLNLYGSHFYVNHLTVEGQVASSSDITPRLTISGDNIVVNQSIVRTTADASTWTEAQWTTNIAATGVNIAGVNCGSVVNSNIRNLIVGLNVSPGSNNVLIKNNEVRYIAQDFVDVFNVSNLLIQANFFLDHIQIFDLNKQHSDAIQLEHNPSRNVVIDSNYVVQMTSPSLFWPSAGMGPQYINDLHGFNDFAHAAFSTGIVVTNNVVISNASDGISFDAPGTIITGNTVVGNTNLSGNSWIMATGAGSVIRNNIMNLLAANAAGVIADHNIANTQIQIGGAFYNEASYAGQTISGNYMDGAQFTDVFNNFDPWNFKFDVSLVAGAGNPAIGTGATLT